MFIISYEGTMISCWKYVKPYVCLWH